MTSTARIIASAFLGLGLVTACSSSVESTSPGNTSVDAQAYSASQCDYLQRCQPFAIQTLFGTHDSCVSMLTASIKPELALKGVTVTAAQEQACEAAVTARACDDASTPPACLFRGALADGAACGSTLQCSSGNCYFATGSTCGTCKAFVAEGGDCSDADCASGLSCRSSDNKCIAGAAEGAACTDRFDCSGSLQCVANKCTKPFAEGAACKPLDTAAGACDSTAGLFCKPTAADGSAGACAKLAVAEVGGACGFDQATSTATLCASSQCDAPQGTAAGKCVPFLAEGAACSATTAGCSFGLGCTDGVCKRVDVAACNP